MDDKSVQIFLQYAADPHDFTGGNVSPRSRGIALSSGVGKQDIPSVEAGPSYAYIADSGAFSPVLNLFDISLTFKDA